MNQAINWCRRQYRSIVKGVSRLAKQLLLFICIWLIIIILIAITYICFNLELTADDVVRYVAMFLISLLSVLLIQKSTDRKAVLIEVVMSYLISGDKAALDHLLGKLIGAKRGVLALKPGTALFTALKNECLSPDWEMRRRISEALPALAQIDIDETLELADILRTDWDEKRWGSDVRRRTIEGLCIAPAPGIAPLLELAPSICVKHLRLHDKDEIYTAIAVLEAVFLLFDIKPKLAEQCLSYFREDLQSMPYSNEAKAFESLSKVLALAKSTLSGTIAEIETLAIGGSELEKLIAARSLVFVLGNHPNRVLKIFDILSNPSQQKNIRRPLARERVVHFLITTSSSSDIEPKLYALRMLMRLLNDPDEIIRIAAFDQVESLAEVNCSLLREICALIIKQETPLFLVERARRILEEHTRK